jgi:hypothetical protein
MRFILAEPVSVFVYFEIVPADVWPTPGYQPIVPAEVKLLFWLVGSPSLVFAYSKQNRCRICKIHKLHMPIKDHSTCCKLCGKRIRQARTSYYPTLQTRKNPTHSRDRNRFKVMWFLGQHSRNLRAPFQTSHQCLAFALPDSVAGYLQLPRARVAVTGPEVRVAGSSSQSQLSASSDFGHCRHTLREVNT